MSHKLLLLSCAMALIFRIPGQCDTDGNADGGICCDADFNGNGFAGAPTCSTAGTVYPADMVNSDIDCGPLDDPACTIPLDGGLSLLALAGGGLATAAMRRRREEEEVATQGAA